MTTARAGGTTRPLRERASNGGTSTASQVNVMAPARLHPTVSMRVTVQGISSRLTPKPIPANAARDGSGRCSGACIEPSSRARVAASSTAIASHPANQTRRPPTVGMIPVAEASGANASD